MGNPENDCAGYRLTGAPEGESKLLVASRLPETLRHVDDSTDLWPHDRWLGAIKQYQGEGAPGSRTVSWSCELQVCNSTFRCASI
jgi:hypothetical protein